MSAPPVYEHCEERREGGMFYVILDYWESCYLVHPHLPPLPVAMRCNLPILVLVILP